jgi:hypothetical protein
VCKGFFGSHRAHRGQQIGRVVVSDYDEIVAEALYLRSAEKAGIVEDE